MRLLDWREFGGVGCYTAQGWAATSAFEFREGKDACERSVEYSTWCTCARRMDEFMRGSMMDTDSLRAVAARRYAQTYAYVGARTRAGCSFEWLALAEYRARCSTWATLAARWRCLFCAAAATSGASVRPTHARQGAPHIYAAQSTIQTRVCLLTGRALARRGVWGTRSGRWSGKAERAIGQRRFSLRTTRSSLAS